MAKAQMETVATNKAMESKNAKLALGVHLNELFHVAR
jgi:hypothetical protein